MKFYAAEIILGLEHMHLRSIVYRDLKVIHRQLNLFREFVFFFVASEYFT